MIRCKFSSSPPLFKGGNIFQGSVEYFDVSLETQLIAFHRVCAFMKWLWFERGQSVHTNHLPQASTQSKYGDVEGKKVIVRLFVCLQQSNDAIVYTFTPDPPLLLLGI